MNEIKSIPIGIISLLLDYEDEQLIKNAFYEFSLCKTNENMEFINKYYFIENNICTKVETTSTYRCSINILDYSDKIKIEFCSDTLFLNNEQYKFLNSFITNLQKTYNFNVKTNSIKK